MQQQSNYGSVSFELERIISRDIKPVYDGEVHIFDTHSAKLEAKIDETTAGAYKSSFNVLKAALLADGSTFSFSLGGTTIETVTSDTCLSGIRPKALAFKKRLGAFGWYEWDIEWDEPPSGESGVVAIRRDYFYQRDGRDMNTCRVECRVQYASAQTESQAQASLSTFDDSPGAAYLRRSRTWSWTETNRSSVIYRYEYEERARLLPSSIGDGGSVVTVAYAVDAKTMDVSITFSANRSTSIASIVALAETELTRLITAYVPGGSVTSKSINRNEYENRVELSASVVGTLGVNRYLRSVNYRETQGIEWHNKMSATDSRTPQILREPIGMVTEQIRIVGDTAFPAVPAGMLDDDDNAYRNDFGVTYNTPSISFDGAVVKGYAMDVKYVWTLQEAKGTGTADLATKVSGTTE